MLKKGNQKFAFWGIDDIISAQLKELERIMYGL